MCAGGVPDPGAAELREPPQEHVGAPPPQRLQHPAPLPHHVAAPGRARQRLRQPPHRGQILLCRLCHSDT